MRVFFHDAGIYFLSLGIFERVQQRSSHVEILRCFRSAAGGKAHFAELISARSTQCNIATRQIERADLALDLFAVLSFVSNQQEA